MLLDMYNYSNKLGIQKLLGKIKNSQFGYNTDIIRELFVSNNINKTYIKVLK
jgi:hypothetical protein